MSEPISYQAHLDSLAADIKTAFSDYSATSNSEPIFLFIHGQGRMNREFADVLVENITQSAANVVVLIRNDLLIQFLVSSINLRCGKTIVKACKTEKEARIWLGTMLSTN